MISPSVMSSWTPGAENRFVGAGTVWPARETQGRRRALARYRLFLADLERIVQDAHRVGDL
jgi:hypothetical protein